MRVVKQGGCVNASLGFHAFLSERRHGSLSPLDFPSFLRSTIPEKSLACARAPGPGKLGPGDRTGLLFYLPHLQLVVLLWLFAAEIAWKMSSCGVCSINSSDATGIQALEGWALIGLTSWEDLAFCPTPTLPLQKKVGPDQWLHPVQSAQSSPCPEENGEHASQHLWSLWQPCSSGLYREAAMGEI